MQVPSGGGGAVAAAPAGGAGAAPAAEEKKPEKEEEKVCTLITRCHVEANIDVGGGIGRRHGLWSVRLESDNYVVVYCLLTSFLTPYRRRKCTAPTLQGDIGSGDSDYRNAGGPIRSGKAARPAASVGQISIIASASMNEYQEY